MPTKPYRKPNDDPVYINRSSNANSPTVSTNKSTKLSCSKETFNEAAQTYNDALKQSDFNNRLDYEPSESNKHITGADSTT